MDKYIGKKLDGRYEVLELVGIGGMANVYKALDILEDKIVAVKILRDEFATNEEFVRRFKNESKAIAVLSHPNIVRVYDVSFTDQYQFIVMEYVNGITLKEYISQQQQINWKEVVHYTIEVLRALQHAHDKGIVHRDIKPHNIMLLANGTIKVMDFGIARFARSETRTITDKAIGSVHYISPEQARGDATDEKTDIYSVGVMMFEMLTGQLPFEADSPVSVAIKQISANPVRPRQINPNIPEGLEDIVIKSMQKDAAKRYHTASEMLRDIDEFKRNPSIHFEYKYMGDSQPTMYYDAVMRKSHMAMQQQKQAPKPVKKGKRRDDNEDEDRRSAVIPIMTGVAMAFVVCALVFMAYIFIVENPFARVADITMPRLIGLPYTAAINLKDCEHFTFNIVEEDYTTEYQEGIIYAQNPAEGRDVKENATIEVKVSLGISRLVVPDLTNVDRQTGFQRLTNMGLTYREETDYDSTIMSGYIIRTDPPLGTEVNQDTIITVYVSKGPETVLVTVPDLLTDKHSQREAQLILEVNGLKLGEVESVDSDKPEGTVVYQSIKAGEEVEEGTAVDIRLSNGSATTRSYTFNPVYMPDITYPMLMQIKVDDEYIYSEYVVPADINPYSFTAEVKEGSTVEILLDGKTLKLYNMVLGSDGNLELQVLIDDRDYF